MTNNLITKYNKASGSQKAIVIVLILGFLGLVVWGVGSATNLWAIAPGATSTTTSESTFRLISYVDGEDVSDFVEITLWVPKGDDYIEDWEDVFTMSNFEEDVSGKDAEDIEFDISTFDYVWVEISPDNTTFFAKDFKLISGGVNALYTYYVYHMPSDLDGNILDKADGGLMLQTKAFDGAITQADGNFTVFLDVPHRYNQELHKGNDWDIDTDDWGDYTEREKDVVMNQRNYRAIAPVYLPASDLLKEFDDDLDRITTAYCIELDFNDTVSITNADTKQVNVTINKVNGYLPPIMVVVVSDAILLIFTEPITFVDGAYQFALEMQLAESIELTTAKTGTVAVPYGSTNIGAFSAISTINLEAAR